MAKKSATKRKGTKNITKNELKDLISKGKQQGFLTYNEIQNVLPEEMLSVGQIDETLIMFDNHDIEIVDENKSKLVNSIKKVKEEKKKGYYLKERHYGSFMRNFTLPEDVDAEKIEATVTDGVLRVAMPKCEKKQKSRKIEVKKS